MATARRIADALQPGDLDATLEQITATAVEVLEAVDYASVTVRYSDGRLEARAPTDPLLGPLDKAQHEYQQGPCYDAATDTVHVVVRDLQTDTRYPDYAPVALNAGIRSQAAIRLFDTPKSQGALNLYSHEVGAFDDIASLTALFASQAGMVIAYAQEIGNLQEALTTRKTIGQAMGILMERYQLSDERAFAFLTRLSQQRNVKLRLVAQEFIAASEQRSDPS